MSSSGSPVATGEKNRPSWAGVRPNVTAGWYSIADVGVGAAIPGASAEARKVVARTVSSGAGSAAVDEGSGQTRLDWPSSGCNELR